MQKKKKLRDGTSICIWWDSGVEGPPKIDGFFFFEGISWELVGVNIKFEVVELVFSSGVIWILDILFDNFFGWNKGGLESGLLELDAKLKLKLPPELVDLFALKLNFFTPSLLLPPPKLNEVQDEILFVGKSKLPVVVVAAVVVVAFPPRLNSAVLLLLPIFEKSKLDSFFFPTTTKIKGSFICRRLGSVWSWAKTKI